MGHERYAFAGMPISAILIGTARPIDFVALYVIDINPVAPVTSARMPLASRVTVFSRWQERRTVGEQWINNLQIDCFNKLSDRMELTPDKVVRAGCGFYAIFLFRIVEIISQSTSYTIWRAVQVIGAIALLDWCSQLCWFVVAVLRTI